MDLLHSNFLADISPRLSKPMDGTPDASSRRSLRKSALMRFQALPMPAGFSPEPSLATFGDQRRADAQDDDDGFQLPTLSNQFSPVTPFLSRRVLFGSPQCASPGFSSPAVAKKKSSRAKKPYSPLIEASSPCISLHKTRSLQFVRDEPVCRLSSPVIKKALDKDTSQPDLVGDFSRPHSLPTIPGKHSDLLSITAATMAKVLKGDFSNVISKFVIIDCRYPYEFEGGHIQDAQNLHTRTVVEQEFITSTDYHDMTDPNCNSIHLVLIFHCEFSSERGPRMCRFLRELDRAANTHCYPKLHYPEIYILHDGYKAFYEQYAELCEPSAYIPMLHADYSAQLKLYRGKSSKEKKSRRKTRQKLVL